MVTDSGAPQPSLGWIGAGRMGLELASRLLRAGHDLAVYNRTRAKAEPLEAQGATLVDSPAELADREIVFTIVAGPDDFKQVILGEGGLLSGPDSRLRIIVDSTTISPDASQEVREGAAARGVQLLAAPVSGNPKVVAAGLLTFVVSGPRAAFDDVNPYLNLLGTRATYVGEGERARLAKICHNLLLGVVAETLAEIAVLAEKEGVPRAALFEFINESVMGSMFTRYKTPAYVNLDFTPTFTPPLLRKDFDLGLDQARKSGVNMPVAETARGRVQELIDRGRTDEDFAALIALAAEEAGYEIQPEAADVSDGLGPGDRAEGERAAAG